MADLKRKSITVQHEIVAKKASSIVRCLLPSFEGADESEDYDISKLKAESEDLVDIVSALTVNSASSTYAEKLKILTVLPTSWTLKRIQSTFGVTSHMARKAEDMRACGGALSGPITKREIESGNRATYN